MKIFVNLFALIILNSDILYFIEPISVASTRIFNIDNEEITVTHEVEDMFYGLYQGDKTGYLLLKKDGTGEYKYDIFGVTSSHCMKGIIQFEWGIPLTRLHRRILRA